MSGGKGGRQNNEVTMPAFAESALQQGVGMAQDVSALGYGPYYSQDVAAFSPQQRHFRHKPNGRCFWNA